MCLVDMADLLSDNSNVSVLYLSLPSSAAAPPGMIFVINMPGSSPIWGLSVPPAILNPRPEFPCRNNKETLNDVAVTQTQFPLHSVLSSHCLNGSQGTTVLCAKP